LTTAEELAVVSGGGTGCPYVIDKQSPLLRRQAALRQQAKSCTGVYTWRGSLNHYNQYGQLDYTVDGRGLNAGQLAQAVVTLDTNPTGNPVYTQNYQLYQKTYSYAGAWGDQTGESTAPITTTVNNVTTFGPVTTTTAYDADGNATSTT
jgi:hypothetical protein